MRPVTRTRRSAASPLPQLPWRAVTNPHAPFEILSADQIEAIHETSLQMLEQIGVELMSASARESLRQRGAEVDEASGVVKLDRAIVEWALSQAPSSFTLTSRNPAKQLTIGGRSVAFGDLQGFVHLLSREDGKVLARLSTDGSAVASRPVVAGNTLVVLTRSGGVFGFAPQ